MNRLSATSIIVSAILAMTMLLFIAWFEQPPPPVESPVPSSAARAVTADTNDAPACDDVEAGMRELVLRSRACERDADCAIFDYGYPIECMNSVARASIPALRREFRRYHASCEYRVYYDCPTGDMQRLPVCRQNRCEVELVTIDFLQDATLDHLQTN